jgi:hypothetical protein
MLQAETLAAHRPRCAGGCGGEQGVAGKQEQRDGTRFGQAEVAAPFYQEAVCEAQ